MVDKLENSPLNLQATSVYNFNEFSLTELLNRFFVTINQCVDSSNQALEFLSWLKSEGLPEEVDKELELMYSDGRLETLINKYADDLKGQVTELESNLNTEINNMSNSLNTEIESLNTTMNTHVFSLASETNKINDTIPYLENVKNERIRKIGHRGYSGLYPENSLIAFEKAKGKFWGVECDTTISLDGTWYIMHDDTLDRTTTGTGAIGNLTDLQINELVIDGGANVAYYPNQKIPTLEQYLQVCKKCDLVPIIEIKATNVVYTDGQLMNLLDLIAKNGLLEKAHIISFGLSILQNIRRLNPNITLQYVVSTWDSAYLQSCIELGNCLLDINYSACTRAIVYECHTYGVLVNVWTSNGFSKNKELANMGVDFITSDFCLEEV